MSAKVEAGGVRGWGLPALAQRYHYFEGSISLCGKWMFGGQLFDDNHDSRKNCRACWRKREKDYGGAAP